MNEALSDFINYDERFLYALTIEKAEFSRAKFKTLLLDKLNKTISILSISITDTDIADENIESLINILAEKNIALISIDLHDNKYISNKAMTALSKAPSLQKINIGLTDVDDKGITELLKLPRLTELKAYNNEEVTDKSAIAIAKNATIKAIDLRNTSITDAGVCALADSASLTIINASANPDRRKITGKSIAKLADNLKLREVEVIFTREKKDSKSLLAGFRQNNNLVSLEIEINCPTEQDRQSITEINAKILQNRRLEYMLMLIVIANTQATNPFSKLPQEILLQIISFLGTTFDYIEKKPAQAIGLAKFIFSKITAINAKIKSRQPFNINEKASSSQEQTTYDFSLNEYSHKRRSSSKGKQEIEAVSKKVRQTL